MKRGRTDLIKREKMKKECSLFIAVIMLILMVACSSEPHKTAENKPASEAKPAFQSSFDTGRAALQRIYIAARNWSVDSRPYRLESQPTKDANGHDGKSGIWQAGF